ncbi:HAD family hydrolase [Candidatus Nanohalovita haloferacivicina]|uniref:HAD family hydrolase n=1 Tax=Candidatus Nanohalovita haloferacivicina TaxID=2978046 RepID=UPI00325FB046|nr:Beta-phosphoglucomutase [Candidatus Nanohalobia archaeon BNXNv]
MKAIVFDMDGVIAETEKFHTEAKQEVLADHGIETDAEELEEKYAGTPSENMFKQVFKEHNIDADHEEAAARKRQTYHEIIQGQIHEIEGAKALIQELSENHELVLASSSARRNIQMILKSTGLEEYFIETLSAKDEGINGKPEPDIYLEAAEILEEKPENCVAIEDSDNGIKSAKKAGMKVVGFRNQRPETDLSIESFEDLSVERLKQL